MTYPVKVCISICFRFVWAILQVFPIFAAANLALSPGKICPRPALPAAQLQTKPSKFNDLPMKNLGTLFA
ncbi:hypothetical protein [Sneathiella chinensis]|uniref:hypothetical protein n=1 Tax=Sneathiella chinensis TaxID=349750 RepID=UPI00146B3DD3|nr:hypothetical protein [Sneathiella chinensis]